MSYLYDAFFSYKRDPQSDLWHATVKDKIRYWLETELGQGEGKIFFDTADLATGDRWPERISEALRRAKCLICVWSPNYFRSKWCVSEWQTFIAREQRIGGGLSLIVPATYHDGESFPAAAKAYQTADFRPYASTMPFFWETEDAFKFEKVLKTFALDLAKKMAACPPFDPAFPVVEARDDQVLPPAVIPRPAERAA